MSNTEPKMALVSAQETKEFKKTRMKEIRAMVSKALKNNQRIDLMEFTRTDIPRVIVALQDEVMKSRTRHAKATKLYANLRETVRDTIPMMTSLFNEQERQIAKYRDDYFVAQGVVGKLHSDVMEQAQQIDSLTKTVETLR